MGKKARKTARMDSVTSPTHTHTHMNKNLESHDTAHPCTEESDMDWRMMLEEIGENHASNAVRVIRSALFPAWKCCAA
eukprot:scaffold239273_cov22-Tisochrysis_lutea.AAC.1